MLNKRNGSENQRNNSSNVSRRRPEIIERADQSYFKNSNNILNYISERNRLFSSKESISKFKQHSTTIRKIASYRTRKSSRNT